MATTVLTYKEAANHVGLTERSIRNYIRRGFLTPQRIAGSRQKFLLAADVEELRSLRAEQAGKPVSRQEILLLTARVAKLEYTLQTVLTLLDAKTIPLGITSEYAQQLHQAATDQLRLTAWSPEEIVPWVDIFLRIDENDFIIMREVIRNGTPWVPFIRLCTAMSESVVRAGAYASSLQLQDIHRQLAEARRRLRAAIVVYDGLQNGGTSLPTQSVSVVDALDSVLGIKK
jgi:hypothetical protein